MLESTTTHTTDDFANTFFDLKRHDAASPQSQQQNIKKLVSGHDDHKFRFQTKNYDPSTFCIGGMQEPDLEEPLPLGIDQDNLFVFGQEECKNLMRCLSAAPCTSFQDKIEDEGGTPIAPPPAAAVGRHTPSNHFQDASRRIGGLQVTNAEYYYSPYYPSRCSQTNAPEVQSAGYMSMCG
jgi:hypothetical protein